MAYKTYRERHPELLIWRAEFDRPDGLERVPLGCERGLCVTWSGDWLWIEVRSLTSGKIIDGRRYPMHPLAGVVREKPWKHG